MKSIAILALANSVAIICAISAATMCFRDKPGWGWFLFVAATCAVTSVKLK